MLGELSRCFAVTFCQLFFNDFIVEAYLHFNLKAASRLSVLPLIHKFFISGHRRECVPVALMDALVVAAVDL